MTTPLAALEERIAKLERASDEIREATRLAHEATKDLRALIREAREILSTKPITDRIDDNVKAGLEEYAGTIKAAQEAAVDRVARTFDELAAIYLGEDEGLSLATLAERRRAAREGRS